MSVGLKKLPNVKGYWSTTKSGFFHSGIITLVICQDCLKISIDTHKVLEIDINVTYHQTPLYNKIGKTK